MSISDNEELDAKPAARPTEAGKKRDHAHHGGSSNSLEGAAADDPAGGGRHEKVVLTAEQRMEVSYRRTAALLRGADEFGLGSSSGSGYCGDDTEISVIPSLVSLSDEFFRPRPPPAAAAASSAAAFPELAGAAAAATSAATSGAASAGYYAHPTHPSYAPSGHPRPTSAAAAAATPLPTSATATLRPTRRTTRTASGQRDGLQYTLRPRLLTSYSSSSFNSGGGGRYGGDGAPPESWPIGPQGAPVPSHLLESDDNTMGEGGDSGRSSATVFSLGQRASGDDASTSVTYSPRPSFGDLLEPPLSAPTFGGQRPPEGAFGSRAGSRTPGSPFGQRSRPSTAAANSGRPVHVNAVKALEHAVKRLEERLKGDKGQKLNAAKSNPYDVEELESDVVTKLADIMLHPPTGKIGDRYYWDEDDKSEGAGDKDAKMGREKENAFPDIHAGKPDGPEGVSNLDESWDESVICEEAVDVATKTSDHPLSSQPASKPRYPTITALRAALSSSYAALPRRVCQYPFKRNDIVWVCRTCQSDETCVLCHECFSHSNHEGHDVAFYHAQAGGCCDCGDGDAWDPRGFCPKHGGACKSGDTQKFGEGGLDAAPAVLGSARACAEHLVAVVRAGVEGGYRRANPQWFPPKETAATTAAAPKMGGRSDSALPEYYDERDGGRERRRARGLRRRGSLERRNTVADAETAGASGVAADVRPRPPVTSPVGTPMTSFREEDEEGKEEEMDDAGETSALPTATSTNSLRSNAMSATSLRSLEQREARTSLGQPTAPILHEVQFDPAMASSSKRTTMDMSVDEGSYQDDDDGGSGNGSNVFCPAAASASKSHAKSSSSSPPAAKKPRAPSLDDPERGPAAEATTPARALGDLGREQKGLFLVLHCDDVHMGGHATHGNSSSHHVVIGALKELYSTPGGGGGSSGPGSGGAGDAGAGSALASRTGRNRFPGGVSTAGETETADLTTAGRHRPLNRILGLPAGTTSRSSPFRAPHAEAILEKIVKIVQAEGDLVVWGTQEILAECGDVTARCWRDGDPRASAVAGAALLERARLLTARGLVVSVKTRKELRDERRAAAVLALLGRVAASCDALCDRVAGGLASTASTEGSGRPTGGGALTPLLRNDLKLPRRVVTEWHSLLLTLLSVPLFKQAMANSYCDIYRAVTAEYARGVGMIERSSYTLSVQFLNRVSYVTDLVKTRNLLSNLARCLLETMRSASFVPGTPGAPPPAGATPDVLDDLDAPRRGASSLTAAVLALLGVFAAERGACDADEPLVRLDAEIDDLLFRGGEEGADGGGGDSRHHGRGAARNLRGVGGIAEAGKATAANLLRRTAALVPPTLDPAHPVLSHRRYGVCISDLKCVLNVDGMARHFASFPASGDGSRRALDDWLKTLSLAQNMDAQMWRPWAKGHVETEPKGWVGAFNASISLSSLFERLLNWDDGDPSPITNTGIRLLSCAEFTHHVLTAGLHHWQRAEMLSHRPTRPPCLRPNPKLPAYALAPASLPFSTVAAAHGAPLAMTALPVPQISVWSFHLPLHRFAAACVRELSRRHGSGGVPDLLQMFALPSDETGQEYSTQLRTNAMLFRGLMEFPLIVLSRAAQIRAGIWRRNGPTMADQVLNYSEPPFCRPLADADVLLLQFALVCHASHVVGGTPGRMDQSANGPVFGGTGTSRLVNLLIHRFGCFDFLGYEKAPTSAVDQYKKEVQMGLYPPEIKVADDNDDDSDDESTPKELVLPWTYSPATDPAFCMGLVNELLHLIIILVTEMPSPSPRDQNELALEAKRRLKREVIHRLASGNKTHSEMAEVHHVLTQRDNFALTESGKLVNPDDASGAALEDALGEVAIRKCKTGSPDEWELNKEAWKEYDPAFHHISTRAHQSATENRPKPSPSSPYAPCPAPAHVDFRRIRRDLTADACVLSMAYRVLHVHCTQGLGGASPDSDTEIPGRAMYDKEIKSETALARAVHLLTLGAFVWEDSTLEDVAGGCDVGSVFHSQGATPNACDWVKVALLREPALVMCSEWYRGKENALALLKKIAYEGANTSDPSLRAGAAWLCEFAAQNNPAAAALASEGSAAGEGLSKEEELASKRTAAKERAMAMMKAQMAKFSAAAGLDEDDDQMSEDLEAGTSRSPSRGSDEAPNVSTPVRTRSDSVGADTVQSIGEDFSLASPLPASHLHTPRTPHTPHSGCSTPRITSEHTGIRLLYERPQCIVCGADTDPMQLDVSLGDADSKMPAKASSDGEANQEKPLAFCGYAQASTVTMGGDGVPSRVQPSDYPSANSHVGVHIVLCGHAIHKSCCDSYLKSMLHRDDTLDGLRRKEFRCPLCQRLSNCLVPFVDVGADWLDLPTSKKTLELPAVFKTEEEPMSVDSMSCSDGETKFEGPSTLHEFLSASKWWVSRNDRSLSWDGQCTFSEATSDSADAIAKPSQPDRPTLSPRQSLRKIPKFGKKELISAWNAVLKTPRLVRRRARSLSMDRGPAMPILESSDASQKPSPGANKSSDVLRKFMDQLSDVAHRADLRRLGEGALFNDFGEFRHYLSEKAACNKINRAAGKELVEWPTCLSATGLTETHRQELSREKLVSKLLFSIQAFTYTCCSEAAEARHLLRDLSSPNDKQSILSKFGVGETMLDGDLLLLPEPNSSVDDGFQPFDGRMGKLRYLGLALMVATSPVAKEVVQLCMSFPVQVAPTDPFDFDEDVKSTIKRAPVAYPILCGHVLSHTTAALIAVTGRARAEEGKYSVDSVIDDCRNFVQLGLIARVAQAILAKLKPSFGGDPAWERQVYFVVQKEISQKVAAADQEEQEWRQFCLSVLQALFSSETAAESQSVDDNKVASHVFTAIESAKMEAVAFLRDLSVVGQILIPNIFCNSAREVDGECDNQTLILQQYMTLFGTESPCKMLKSSLLQGIVESWYADAIAKNPNRMDYPRMFQGTAWPVSPFSYQRVQSNEMPPNCLPLFGNRYLMQDEGSDPPPRICYLPKSYTDLYAQLGEMCPNNEQTALCLVCGQVLNPSGKGECTRHAYKCGGGAGIFFLVQECVGLIMHGQKAAYVHSPYVDFYGETPQYRGRPLNLDLDRYRILQSLWSGHLVREKVVAERASTRQVIITGFY